MWMGKELEKTTITQYEADYKNMRYRSYDEIIGNRKSWRMINGEVLIRYKYNIYRWINTKVKKY